MLPLSRTSHCPVGLYMSKIIIEKNMKGSIEAQRLASGMALSIRLPLPS